MTVLTEFQANAPAPAPANTVIRPPSSARSRLSVAVLDAEAFDPAPDTAADQIRPVSAVSAATSIAPPAATVEFSMVASTVLPAPSPIRFRATDRPTEPLDCDLFVSFPHDAARLPACAITIVESVALIVMLPADTMAGTPPIAGQFLMNASVSLST